MATKTIEKQIDPEIKVGADVKTAVVNGCLVWSVEKLWWNGQFKFGVDTQGIGYNLVPPSYTDEEGNMHTKHILVVLNPKDIDKLPEDVISKEDLGNEILHMADHAVAYRQRIVAANDPEKQKGF